MMIRRIAGLEEGPPLLSVFRHGGVKPRTSISVVDEVRCRKGAQEIFLSVLSISDGPRSLLGRVMCLGAGNGDDSFEVAVGDLVEFPSDRILALYR